MIVVADAGPIIHLSLLGHLDLLPALFGKVVVPRRVYQEVVQAGQGLPGSSELQAAAWVELDERDLRTGVSRLLLSHLDAGEADALALASEIMADLVLSDDRQARIAAGRLGLRVQGTLGVLLEARRRGRIQILAPLLSDLRLAGVWLSDALIEQVLRSAGEVVSGDRELGDESLRGG